MEDRRGSYGVLMSLEALPWTVPQSVLVSWKVAPFVVLMEAASFVLKAASFVLGAGCR